MSWRFFFLLICDHNGNCDPWIRYATVQIRLADIATAVFRRCYQFLQALDNKRWRPAWRLDLFSDHF